MRLREIDFGHCLNASGARNFDGSGWWYHGLARWVGLNYRDSTFVAKTTTMGPRLGNMHLKGSFDSRAGDANPKALHPIETFPDCIRVDWRKGHVLNAVGLSGPGAEWLLENQVWRNQEKPFFLSFMAVSQMKEARQIELVEFVDLLKQYLPFQVPIGLQINFSCPNVGLDPHKLIDEIQEALKIASVLNIPLVPKINATFPHEIAFLIGDRFDALCVSNSIPWGQLPDRIDWVDLFGSSTSPLAQYGGGGLSGAPLLPIVGDWIRKLRDRGFRKPIIGAGGVLSQDCARFLVTCGANAIELGAVSMLRPWRVRGIIQHVNDLLRPGS